MLAWSAVDRGFEHWLNQTINLVFAASPLSKHSALRSKKKDWFSWTHDNAS